MYWHVSGFAEFCVPDREDALIKICIAASQVESFGKALASGGNQSEDCLISRGSQSTVWGKESGGGEKIADLLLRVDVGRETPMRTAKDCGLRELGRRIDPHQISCEGTKHVQTARPRQGLGVFGLTQHPIQGDAGCQGTSMACRVNEAGKRGDLVSWNTQIKSQPAAFGQVILGQGKATAESLVKSTLA